MKLIARIAISSIGVVIGTAVGATFGVLGPLLFGMLLVFTTGDPTAGAFVGFVMILTVPGGVIAGAVLGGILANKLADRFTPALNQSSFLVRATVRTVISGIAGYIAGGFVAGAMSMEDGFGSRNPLAYLASGVYGCATFLLSPGRALAMDGDRPINAWPHFFVCWIVFVLAIACWARYGEIRKPKPDERACESEAKSDEFLKQILGKGKRPRNRD